MSTGGYIYAIGAHGTGLVKIGYTKAVDKRLKLLQTGQPFPLQVLASIPVETDASRIERQVHAFLTEERRRGEWFEVVMDTDALTALVLRAITYLAEQDAPLVPAGAEGGSKKFGERLKRIREKQGLSMQELSQKAEVPYETIYRVERGMHQEPRVSVAAKLARALGVSLDVLAGVYEDDESRLEPAAVELVGA